MLARIDEARGDVPRARWVERAIERKLAVYEPTPGEVLAAPDGVTFERVREAVDAAVGHCPKATCSAAGLIGEPCPLHPNMRFKVL